MSRLSSSSRRARTDSERESSPISVVGLGSHPSPQFQRPCAHPWPRHPRLLISISEAILFPRSCINSQIKLYTVSPLIHQGTPTLTLLVHRSKRSSTPITYRAVDNINQNIHRPFPMAPPAQTPTNPSITRWIHYRSRSIPSMRCRWPDRSSRSP